MIGTNSKSIYTVALLMPYLNISHQHSRGFFLRTKLFGKLWHCIIHYLMGFHSEGIVHSPKDKLISVSLKTKIIIIALCILQCVDQLTKIQTELQETVKDLAKGKKKYFETEQMAQAVREKADIEAKYVLAFLKK